MGCGCMQEYTFAEPMLEFAEPSYSIGEMVAEDGSDSRLSNLNFMASINQATITIAASWNRTTTSTSLDRCSIRQYDPSGTLIHTTSFAVTAEAGHNEFTLGVPNMMTTNGNWKVSVNIHPSNTSAGLTSARTVTVNLAGGGGGGGTGDDPRFDAIFGSLANIQDWIITAQDQMDVADARILGLEDNLQILRNDALELGADVALVDKVLGGEIINMQRYANYPQDYSARFNTFYSSVVSNNPDSVSGGAVLAAPLLNSAQYTYPQSGGGGSFLDAIFAFFNGFGIGSTAAIIIIAVVAYLILRRK